MGTAKLNIFTSLRAQITLLICTAALASIVLVATQNYLQTSSILLNTAIKDIASETRLMAAGFRSSYDSIENDAAMLANTPPIRGLMRSISNNGLDPRDGSTTYLWKSRLETTFKSVMSFRHHYTQIRYIGLEDNGRELFGIKRIGKELISTPESNLKSRGDEEYFQQGVKLTTSKAYFSEIAYDTESPHLNGNDLPILRVLLPIFNNQNQVFGFILIDVNYPKLLWYALNEIRPSKNTYLLNYAGDYLEYSKEGFIQHIEFKKNYSRPAPKFIAQISSLTEAEADLSDDKYIRYFARINVNEQIHTNAFFGILLEEKREELLAATNKQRINTLIYSLILVIVIINFTAWAIIRYTKPLNTMTKTLDHADETTENLNLPTHLNNEIGKLARAFNDMAYRLKNSESRNTEIINNVVDGIITIDENGIIQSFNPACEKMFGYSSSEVIGKNVKVLMPDEHASSHDNYVQNYLKTGKAGIIGIGRELEAKRKDGTLFPIELSISEISRYDHKIFTGMLRDITERKQVERMKDEFVSTVNHELRTPLTAIKTSLEILQIKLQPSLDDKSQHTLEICQKNCEYLTTLVNDILDMERIASGKMEYHISTVELCSLLKETVDRHNDFAEKYHVTYTLDIQESTVYVNADSVRLVQSISNLLSNAAKFSYENNTVAVTLALIGQQHVRIAVRNRGIGIPEEFKDKVFQKFSQADSTATRKQGGSGLGLNITKSMIKAFDGHVYFSSEENKETIFYIELPTTDAPDSADI